MITIFARSTANSIDDLKREARGKTHGKRDLRLKFKISDSNLKFTI
jgi:hypothetical protein